MDTTDVNAKGEECTSEKSIHSTLVGLATSVAPILQTAGSIASVIAETAAALSPINPQLALTVGAGANAVHTVIDALEHMAEAAVIEESTADVTVTGGQKEETNDDDSTTHKRPPERDESESPPKKKCSL